jgi:hypothetical protein
MRRHIAASGFRFLCNQWHVATLHGDSSDDTNPILNRPIGLAWGYRVETKI